MADAHEPEKKAVNVSLVVPDSEKQAIDAWMDAHRIRSMGRAIRTMIRFALANGVQPDDEPDLRRKGQ